MPRLSFRQKVVFLAVMLVIGMQLVTLSSVLDLIKRDGEAKAARQVDLAGCVVARPLFYFVGYHTEQFRYQRLR